MSQPQDVGQEDVRQALDIAKRLIEAGVPVFAAPPCPGESCHRPGHAAGKEEYDLPPKWQQTVPSTVWLDRWQPGWALAAVGGHAADFLDVDPRNGGEASEAELHATGHVPRIYGEQLTPSGGRHMMIAPLGERKGELLPGIDYQGGAPDGEGRGFVWIAPTVKRSKDPATLGQVRPYRWIQPPDTDWLSEGGDDSGDMLVLRLQAMRAKPERQRDDREIREFTDQEARDFCDLTLKPLMAAQIGQIEERANAAAVQLSHFVPEFWGEPTAYAVLLGALEHTAYDPDGPSSWTAEKFHAVLAGQGNRAPDDWKAVRRPEPAEPLPEAEPDEVDALLAEMLHPDQLADLPAPKHLIRGMLLFDSESWLIGAAGSRKSFVALDMAGHIARGLPWQGLETERGRVVYIVAEGKAGVGIRMQAWEKTYGAMDPERNMVYVLPRPVQASNRHAWSVLVGACKRLQPALVVIDTQARVTVGLKENDATDMGYYIEAVRAIREVTEGCVLTIHHTGRNGQDGRGSSALDGAQYTELKVLADDNLRGTLKTDKQKDIEEAADLPLKFDVVDLGLDEQGHPVSSLVLCGQDAWLLDEAKPIDPGQAVVIPDPGEWTWNVAPHPRQEVKRQILETLNALESGRTEAQIKAMVAERWYGGRTRGRGAGVLGKQTWDKNWTDLVAEQVIGKGETGWMLTDDVSGMT